MDRFYQANATASTPAAPGASSGNYPTAGDPATATPATKPGAYWFYMITESLRNVIIDSGLAPDKSVLTRLSEAIKKLISDAVSAAASPTGMMGYFARSTAPTGWVRVTGGTIGNATSGASERAHADCHNLFLLLWNEFPNGMCPVIGGRGVSAEADWAANKRITLFDDQGLYDRALDSTGSVNPLFMLGQYQEDALQGFKIAGAVNVSPGAGGSGAIHQASNTNLYPVSDGTNGTPRIANETRVKSRIYLKCVKL